MHVQNGVSVFDGLNVLVQVMLALVEPDFLLSQVGEVLFFLHPLLFSVEHLLLCNLLLDCLKLSATVLLFKFLLDLMSLHID